MSSSEPSIIALPGDDLTALILKPLTLTEDGTAEVDVSKEGPNKKIKTPKIGVGLSYDSQANTIRATMAGRLFHRKSTNTFMILKNSKRYIPKVNDRIVGIVEERVGEHYRVKIGRDV